MILCIAGKNEIAVKCLYYAFSFLPKEEICVVLNKNDTRVNTWQKSLGFYANKENVAIKTLQEVENINDIIFLSLEYDQIIKPSNFKSKKLYNIHFSLLPEFKGMYTSLHPILQGKKYSGVTLHVIDRGIDTGEIIDQVKFDIQGFTAKELYSMYINEGIKLAYKNLQKILLDKVLSFSQNSDKSTYFSRNSFDFKQTKINPNQTAFQIQQFVNALNFREFQLPNFLDKDICKTKITNKQSLYKPGTIINNNIEIFEISTIDYDIILYKDYFYDFLNCCRLNDIKLAEKIIKFIPDLNEFDGNGWNPLIIACYNGAEKIVKLLLDNGANPNITNLNDTSLIMYAKESFLKTRDFSILRMLIENNVDIDAKDVHGKNIFDYVKDKELINFLIKGKLNNRSKYILKNLGQNTNIQEYGISLKLIEESDAKFILELRNDDKLGQHLSSTSSNINDQINWVKEYKKREANKKEFYFIFADSNHKPWGTIRLYNITEKNFTIGSWICLPNNKEQIAVKAWLLCVEYGFEKLNSEICLFDVRKKNKSVLYYSYLYHPILVKEDELNYFFSLGKDNFYKNCEKIIKLLNFKRQK